MIENLTYYFYFFTNHNHHNFADSIRQHVHCKILLNIIKETKRC